MPSLICALCFPTIPDVPPANDHARSPTMSPTILACAMTNALLMHVSRASARFPYQSGRHHRSCITGHLGCMCSDCAHPRFLQICVRALENDGGFSPVMPLIHDSRGLGYTFACGLGPFPASSLQK